MNEIRRCPECGAEFPANSPAGQCPKCLINAGLESEGPSPPQLEATVPSPASAGFEPPPVERIAAIFPQLEILELIGKGGMGAVYKARQPGLDRLVAVKILPPEVGRDPAFAERFTREARAMARLGHPNVVAIHDFGQTDGLFYFVMEYVDGANLRQAMRAGRLQPSEALAIVPQICDALQFAHDEGIVHRDIKPENILLDKKGRVKIADFGLSKLLREDHRDASLTGTHQVMGTLRYMAPEQMRGTKTVDHRADIYSLGVVFYELLTGDLPMGRFDPPSKKAHTDARLDDVVLRSLAQEPARRYQQAREIRTDVEAVQSGSNIRTVASRHELDSDGSRPQREEGEFAARGPAMGLVCAGILTILFHAGFFAYGLREDPPPLDWPFQAALVGIPFGVFVLLGGIAMLRLRSRELATFGAVMALVPVGPVWLLGLPYGIYALLVLRRERVQQAFREQVRRGSSRWQHADGPGAASRGDALIRGPAELLVATAIMTLMTGIGIVGWWFGTGEFKSERTCVEAPMQWNMMGIAATHGFYALLIGSAAALMLARRARLLSLLVVIAAGLLWPAFLIVNCLGTHVREWATLMPFWVGMPVSVWATVVLLRQDARAAYRQWANDRDRVKATADPRLSRHALCGAIWAGLGLLGLIVVVYCVSVSERVSSDQSTVPRADIGMLSIMILGVAGAAGVSSIFGATILGAVAIGSIKNSAGKLYGLPLAFADMMLYPLLATMTGLSLLVALSLHSVTPLTFLACLLVGVFVGLVAGFLIGRVAWLRIADARGASEPRTSLKRAAVLMLIGGIASGVMVLAMGPETYQNYVEGHFTLPGTILRAASLLAFAVLAGVIVHGALKMLFVEDFAASRRAAICSLFSLPFGIIALPAGIYGLVVLLRPEIKTLFKKDDGVKPKGSPAARKR